MLWQWNRFLLPALLCPLHLVDKHAEMAHVQLFERGNIEIEAKLLYLAVVSSTEGACDPGQLWRRDSRIILILCAGR